MKWLLFLFVLFPFVLFAQPRRKAIVDSINSAAGNFQDVSSFISNNPSTRVDYMHATDSGEYVTVVVRIHVTELIVVGTLSPLQVVRIETKASVAGQITALAVPLLPILRPELDTIIALSLFAAVELKTEFAPIAKMSAVMEPLFTELIFVDPLEALPFAAASQLVIKPRPMGYLADAASIPVLPNIAEEIEVIQPRAVNEFSIGHRAFGMLYAAAIPVLPIIPEEIEAVQLLTVCQLRADRGNVRKLEMAPVLDLPRIGEPMEAVPYCAVEMLGIESMPGREIDMVAVPPLQEECVPVAEMHLSESGYGLLEKLEGFSPELYSLRDGGFTIGFGFFVPYGEANKWNKGVTWEEADRIIRQKVPVYEDQVKQYINVALTQEEFDALTMLAYNLGGFSKATSIVNDINNGDSDKLQHDWMRFVHSKAPNVMKGLMNRRKDELQVSNDSNYQNERKILVFRNRK